ncbi:MAG: glycosyltransferase family 39 protein [Anaerolineae bacterium]|nr:glycosyltransferase family 39 protein [Anaerolineae bacterium]
MDTIVARPRTFWLWAALIVVVGAALRLYDLGGPSLWVDEVYTATLAHASLGDMLLMVRDLGNQAPLYYLLLHAYPNASDFALRSFSALMGVLGIAGTIWAVARLYRSPWLALGAGLLLALNPYHIWLSRTARVYALAFVLALIASYAFLRLLAGERRRANWVVFVLASTSGYVTHYFAAALALAQYLVFGFLLRRKRALFRRWIGAQAVAVIPLLLWIGYMFQAETVAAGLGWIRKPGPADLLLTLSAMTVGTGDAIPLLTVPALIVALSGLGAGLVYAARHYRTEPDLWYWFWLIVGTLALVFAVSLLVRPLYVDRYFVIILPALIVLMLRGWQWLAGPRRPYLAIGAAALVALTGAAITLDVFQAGDHYKEDWRGAAEYVAADFQPGDGVLAGDPAEVIAFKRYFLQAELPPYAWYDADDPLAISPFAEPVTRVWVLTRTTADEGAHQNELALARASAGPVPEKYTPPWVQARRDRVLAEKQFNGLAVFLVDTREEADQLASVE